MRMRYKSSYKSGDGTDHHFASSASSPAEAGVGARQPAEAASHRWENEGGSSEDQPSAYTEKPAWSVRPLRELNEAVRESENPHSPWRLHEEASRAERENAEASRIRAAEIDAHARAYRDRHRNAWENT